MYSLPTFSHINVLTQVRKGLLQMTLAIPHVPRIHITKIHHTSFLLHPHSQHASPMASQHVAGSKEEMVREHLSPTNSVSGRLKGVELSIQIKWWSSDWSIQGLLTSFNPWIQIEVWCPNSIRALLIELIWPSMAWAILSLPTQWNATSSEPNLNVNTQSQTYTFMYEWGSWDQTLRKLEPE